MKGLSLFANIGIAETYLQEAGFHVVVANELLSERAELYSKFYPDVNMIVGDITDEKIQQEIISASVSVGVEFMIITAPCQGMSVAGHMYQDDIRNLLIYPAISIAKRLQPKYILIENVPTFLNTSILIDGEVINITRLIYNYLGQQYNIGIKVLNTQDYLVPQSRKRAILLLSRQDMPQWTFPQPEEHIVSLKEAIGHLPSLDPKVTDISEEEQLKLFPLYYQRKEAGLKYSKWHTPPEHNIRHVQMLMHTPSGCTAFDNPVYYPKKPDGSRIRGFRSTYKRQDWDKPAYTITMNSQSFSSQNNGHPGRLIGKDTDGSDIYSDARVLSLYEIILVTGLPPTWASNLDVPEVLLRQTIGEGIPPLFIYKIFNQIAKECN